MTGRCLSIMLILVRVCVCLDLFYSGVSLPDGWLIGSLLTFLSCVVKAL